MEFNANKIEDNQINPLAKLKSIKKLHFPTSLFTTKQIAWLKTKLPKEIATDILTPYLTFNKPFETRGKLRDILLVGKGKPFLNSEIDKNRIENMYMNSMDILSYLLIIQI